MTPRFVDMCTLSKSKNIISWLVQIAPTTNNKVSKVVKKCPLVMDGLVTHANLNVLPLGSYDVLIGMNWLEAHKTKLDEEGNLRVMKGIPKSDLQ